MAKKWIFGDKVKRVEAGSAHRALIKAMGTVIEHNGDRPGMRCVKTVGDVQVVSDGYLLFWAKHERALVDEWQGSKYPKVDGTSVLLDEVEGTFPNGTAIVPTKPAEYEIMIDARLMIDLLTLFLAGSGRESGDVEPVMLRFHGKNNAFEAVARTADETWDTPDRYALMMPMYKDPEVKIECPTWVRETDLKPAA